jgi:tetratricopeptide (TPR) repeat protein
VDALKSAPVLFLIAVRGAERTRRWSEALRVSPLPLGELDPDASASIVRLALGLPPDDALVRRLHALTGGNPGRLLTALEILRPQLRKEGAAVGVASLDALPVPRDAEAAAARLASSLEPRLLKAAKTLSAHPGFLKESIGHDVLGPTDGDDLLLALSSHGVIRRVSLHTYEWASTALRHELYSRLAGEARRRLHARFARAGRLWMRPGVLNTHLYQAYHLARTEQPTRAQGHALAAARLLAGVFRYGEAADYYELALRLHPAGAEAATVSILRSLQSACRKGGLHRRGKRVSLELLRRRPSQGQYAAAAYFIAMVDGASAAVSFIDRALRAPCRKSPCGLALLLSKRASALAIVGRRASAFRSARRAEVYLGECDDPTTAADVNMDLGSLHFARGSLVLGVGLLPAGAAAGPTGAGCVPRGGALRQRGLALRGQLRHPAALRYARRGLALKLRRGLLYDSATTRTVLAALLDDTGDHDAARTELLKARETFRARGDGCGRPGRPTTSDYPSDPGAACRGHRVVRSGAWRRRPRIAERPALAAHAGKMQVFVSTGDLEKAQAALKSGSLHSTGLSFEARVIWNRARALLALARSDGPRARAAPERGAALAARITRSSPCSSG